jgi:hypothetical protein
VCFICLPVLFRPWQAEAAAHEARAELEAAIAEGDALRREAAEAADRVAALESELEGARKGVDAAVAEERAALDAVRKVVLPSKSIFGLSLLILFYIDISIEKIELRFENTLLFC